MDNRLQARRVALGMTQPQVSERLKEVEPRADVGMVSRYEKGVCLPTSDQLLALETILQAPRSELYDLDDLDLAQRSAPRHGENSGIEATGRDPLPDYIKNPSHAGKVRKCYRIHKEFAASLPPDLLAVCGYSSWQSWYDACMKRLLGEYDARMKAARKAG